MNCHKLLYKPTRKTAPYQDFIRRQNQKKQQNKKQFIYQQILKFRQSRYPLQFLKLLQSQINPFELSLDRLKQLFTAKHPEYSNQLVNQSVQQIFNRKCLESEMIKQSAVVIEYGDQYIRNGRKLIKQDFTYQFKNYQGEDQQQEENNNQDKKKKDQSQDQMMDRSKLLKQLGAGGKQRQPRFKENYKEKTPLSTERAQTDRLVTARSDSPSKIIDMMRKTQRFNEILLEQIKKQRKRYDKLQQIQQNSPNDSIFFFQHSQTQNANFTDRSRQNQSLPSFRQQDLLVRIDNLDTGRSQVQQLNFLLTSLNFQQGQPKQTARSKKSKNALRINRQIKEQLYNARGSLKLEVVRRAIDRLKKEQREAGQQDLNGSRLLLTKRSKY